MQLTYQLLCEQYIHLRVEIELHDVFLVDYVHKKMYAIYPGVFITWQSTQLFTEESSIPQMSEFERWLFVSHASHGPWGGMPLVGWEWNFLKPKGFCPLSWVGLLRVHKGENI